MKPGVVIGGAVAVLAAAGGVWLALLPPAPTLPQAPRRIRLVPAPPPPPPTKTASEAAPPAENVNVHTPAAFANSCLACHIEKDSAQLRAKSVGAVCERCHPKIHSDERNSHPVDVALGRGMHTTMPLSENRIDCHTCHDPHGTRGALLRRKPALLCGECHPAY